MSPELIGLIMTGVISGIDLIVNVVTLCLNGRCACMTPCCYFTHKDSEEDLKETLGKDIEDIKEDLAEMSRRSGVSRDE